MTYITKSQLKEIEEAYFYSLREYHDKLKEYMGIDAESHETYQYFDATGNYIGDSDDSLEELLESAYIEVIGDVE